MVVVPLLADHVPHVVVHGLMLSAAAGRVKIGRVKIPAKITPETALCMTRLAPQQ
jgi:hypothetical protein